MNQQADEHAKTLLRSLKETGAPLADQIDSNVARELVKTPPTASLRTKSSAELERLATQRAQHLKEDKEAASALEALSTQDLVFQLEHDHDAFNTALADNTRLAKEQMQRSLLQLFEDTAREKLLDPNVVARRSAATSTAAGQARLPGSPALAPSSRALASPLSGVMRPSKRPTDRGLDRRDHPSDVIIPDHVRDALSNDIYTVVDHELKRFIAVVTGDLGRILEQVKAVRDRMSKLEEDLMQRAVENKMQADQLTSSANLILQLQEQVASLEDHNTKKDAQMDLLRDQVSRRNTSLDETRVKFRKEVMRYKSRVYELEMELDSTTGKKGPPRRLSIPDGALTADGEEGPSTELMAIAETAVKDVTEKFNEEIRQLHVKYAREKKVYTSEMNMKLSERDNEIIRLKAKINQQQQQLAIEDR